MKIIYEIRGTWNEAESNELAKFGISVPIDSFKAVQIEEELYLKIMNLVGSKNTGVGTKFNEKEFESVKTYIFERIWPSLYPKPDRPDNYKKITYEDSNYCRNCGIGLIQKDFFRIAKEPKWGKHKFMQLNWINDEIFVETDFYFEFFKPLNIDFKKVLLHNSDEACKTILQLDIPKINLELNMRDTPFSICNICDRKKYNPYIKGFHPVYEKALKDLKIFKGIEYFGVGAAAWNRIFISSDIKDKLLKSKAVKKFQFYPCEQSSERFWALSAGTPFEKQMEVKINL